MYRHERKAADGGRMSYQTRSNRHIFKSIIIRYNKRKVARGGATMRHSLYTPSDIPTDMRSDIRSDIVSNTQFDMGPGTRSNSRSHTHPTLRAKILAKTPFLILLALIPAIVLFSTSASMVSTDDECMMYYTADPVSATTYFYERLSGAFDALRLASDTHSETGAGITLKLLKDDIACDTALYIGDGIILTMDLDDHDALLSVTGGPAIVIEPGSTLAIEGGGTWYVKSDDVSPIVSDAGISVGGLVKTIGARDAETTVGGYDYDVYTDGGSPVTRVLVRKPLSDEDRVNIAVAWLTWDLIRGANTAQNTVMTGLLLPSAHIDGASVAWSPSGTSVSAKGIVTRPAYGNADDSVSLTATVTSGSVSDTVVFHLTVKAQTEYITPSGMVIPPPAITYDILFVSNGGSAVRGGPATAGSRVRKPTNPTREGYVFGGWYTDVALTEPYDFTRTVSMRLTLFAKWTPASQGPSGFLDVAAKAWYNDAVVFVKERGLMSGITEEQFLPDAPVARAELVAILYRYAGSPDVSDLSNPFCDAEDHAWYSAAVRWAAANGIAAGYGDSLFGPGDAVTREQLAAIFFRLQQCTGKTPPSTATPKAFSDISSVSDWAVEVVTELNRQGLLKDLPGSRFSPRSPASRADVASVLYHYLSAID